MSFNDLMRRLVIGKNRKDNFTSKDLPKNRKQVFKFIYKNRLIEQFNAGLLCVLLCLPLIAWQIVNISARSNLAVDTSFSPEQLFNEYVNLITTKNLINIPCLMLGAIGLAGLVYVIRKLCFNEPVSILKDFGRGIKNSWLQYLIISFVMGLNIYLIDVIINYLIYYPDVDGALRIALLIFMLLFNLTMLIFYIYSFGIAGLYSANIVQVFKGAFMLTFKKFFTNILMVLAGCLPVMVCYLIPFLIANIIGACIILFGGLSLSVIVLSLFVYAQFDKFINEKNYPELVNKGIYTGEELEDELDEVTEEEIEKLAEKIASEYGEESIE